MRAYYERHRARILAQRKQMNAVKHVCACGAKVGAARLTTHEASDKHMRFLYSRWELEQLKIKVREVLSK